MSPFLSFSSRVSFIAIIKLPVKQLITLLVNNKNSLDFLSNRNGGAGWSVGEQEELESFLLYVFMKKSFFSETLSLCDGLNFLAIM